MTPLGPGEIRARRRPWVVVSVAGLRLVAAFFLAYPLASVVAAGGVGQRAEGDRALFEGGGYLLLELLRLQGPSLSAVVRGLLPLLGLGLLATAASNAALLVALNTAGRLPLRAWLGRSFGHAPGLVLLGVSTGGLQLLLFGVASGVAGGLPDPMARPVASSAVQLAFWLAVAGLAGALGGLSDVAKACLVRYRTGALDAARQGLKCLRRHPLRTAFGWLPFAVVLIGALLAAAQLTEAIDVSRDGVWRVGLVFALHQLVVLLAVALRAAWFARALRLSAS